MDVKLRYTVVKETTQIYEDSGYEESREEGESKEDCILRIERENAVEVIDYALQEDNAEITVSIIQNHAGEEDILQYFKYDHLPKNLQTTSKVFADLANDVIMELPRCPQRTMALNSLLDCKDRAVRAAMWKP